MYFGRSNVCDYDDGLIKDSSFTSGPVNLTDPARAFISFWILYQVESASPSCFDQLRLERSYDGINWALEQKLSPLDPPGGSPAAGMASGSGLAGTPLWQFKRVDLSAYLGLTIYLRFRFLSSGHIAGESLCQVTDASYDNFLGYALDDINFYDSPEPVDLVKTVSPPYGPPGTTANYSIVVTNRDSATQSITVWDSLPSGAIFLSASPPGAFNAGRVDWVLPPLAAGATVTLNLQVQTPLAISVPSDWVNIASAASSAPGSQAQSVPALFKVRSNGLNLRKSVRPSEVTTGDQVTYALVLENYSTVTQTSVVLVDQIPVGFNVLDSFPPISSSGQWPLSPLVPGDVRSFSVWGPVIGIEGQVVNNTAQVLTAGTVVNQSSASLLVHKPIEPAVKIKGIYPNPAPGSNPAFGEAVHIIYDLNQTMPMTLDVFTIAGEKLRSQELDGTRGQHDASWDMKNDWGNGVASGIYVVRVWSTTAVKPIPEAFGYVAVLR